jgi:hypothetical protein
VIWPFWHDVHVVGDGLWQCEAGLLHEMESGGSRVRAVSLLGVGNSQLLSSTTLLATYSFTPYQCSLSGLARNGSRNTFELETELYTIDIPT